MVTSQPALETGAIVVVALGAFKLIEYLVPRKREGPIAAGGVLRVLWGQSSFEDEASLFGQICEKGNMEVEK